MVIAEQKRDFYVGSTAKIKEKGYQLTFSALWVLRECRCSKQYLSTRDGGIETFKYCFDSCRAPVICGALTTCETLVISAVLTTCETLVIAVALAKFVSRSGGRQTWM